MNEKIQHIVNLVQKSSKLSEEEKSGIVKSLQDADKEISISAFKIERLEKVKYTTTVLLEQTIEELETKRKSVEEQKRELEIEAALERVRARTMAMQKSEELPQSANLLFQQIQSLGIPAFAAGYCIWEDDRQAITLWMSSEGILQPPFKAPTTKDELFIQMRKGFEEGKALHVVEMGGEELVAHYQYMRTLPVVGEIFDSIVKAGHSLPVFQVMHQAYFSKGFLLFITYEPVPESHEIFKRFAQVFDQTYTRFLDLQKAEAQTRESQIQLALERVRARTMAMQKSNELAETAHILFQQFKQLGEDPIQITIGTFNEEQNVVEFRITGGDGSGSKIDQTFRADIDEPTLINKFYRAWKENKKSTVISLQGKELSQWIAYRNKISGEYAHETEVKSTDRRYAAAGFFSKGVLSISKTQNPSEETIQILERFASVFDLAYTRFLDLMNAEAQAREANIEASMEKVRSSAMSMHNSNDISSTTTVVFNELKKLGIQSIRCGVALLSKNSREGQIYAATPAADGSLTTLRRTIQMTQHSSQERQYESWLKQENYFVEMKGDELRSYYQLPFFNSSSSFVAPDSYEHTEFGYYIPFSEGLFYAWTKNPYSEDDQKVLNRFKSIIDLTFRRFFDLVKAEAQTKEAQIETALERVRSRTLAMQKSEELAETAAVLFKQLISLGIEPNRLYICIIKDNEANAEFWITDEDGSKVSSGFETNLNENGFFKKMLEGWKLQKVSLTIDMQGTELEDYFKHLTSLNVPFKGGLSQQRRVQNISYFSKGFIGIASPNEQPEETIQLLDRFASVFNLTFTRFNDLQVAEAHALQAEQDLIEIKAARKRAEDALAELKATQQQLVQSEKMASLGELTAGIAHEIQNPLNFVNNFAEINTELVEELKEELSKGKLDQASLVADDLKDNNQKIAFHGKRADSIVKGMLQHSRASSGKKELTDINSLADEFLRLSYHGLRAKDKSFNATMETNFDYNIDKVKIIPQDLGRVLLNLFNNAFYSVNEKKKELNGLYEPKVFVSTEKLNDKIEIVVKDNGNGIPQKIIDKIYQPFFTTKPTGEGTGLGLSLSYDIITKGHNGELKVETKEGEFAQFRIILPTTV